MFFYYFVVPDFEIELLLKKDKVSYRKVAKLG